MSQTSSSYEGKSYLQRLKEAVSRICEDDVVTLAQRLIATRDQGSVVYILGNGGSATTASHLVTDLGVGSARFDAGIRAISLTDNAGAITAVANDVAYEDVFAAQLRLLGTPNDLLIAISASGNSPNVVKAAVTARELGMTVAALTGFDGGWLAGFADLLVHVETASGDYGPVEDCHLAVGHMITEQVRLQIGDSTYSGALHG